MLRRRAIELAAIAQSGLTYVRDEFDRQRYLAVGAAARDLLQLVTAGPLPPLQQMVDPAGGHATPKVDGRGAVFDPAGRVLLVQERSDGRWTLPGGWCDVLESPAESVCREVEEEAGLPVRAVRLAAVLDRERRGHVPPLPVHVYKLFFLCEPLRPPDLDGRPAATGDDAEVLDVGWFDLADLPPLSVTRVTEEELRLVEAAYRDPLLPAVFD